MKTKRAALAAYGGLLVLPTVVLGWLYWRQIVDEYEERLTEVPEEAHDAAARLIESMRERLAVLLEGETRRPFHHYGWDFSPSFPLSDSIELEPSPLTQTPPPEGVVAWFSFDRVDGPDGPIEIFHGVDVHGAHPEGPEHYSWFKELERTVRNFREHKLAEGFIRRAAQLGEIETYEVPLLTVAVHKNHEDNLDCVERCRGMMQDRTVELDVSDFHLQFYLENGVPRAVASRRVLMFEPFLFGELPEEAECLRRVDRGLGIHQGFLLDVDWLLGDLPDSAAEQVLSHTDRLVFHGFSPEVDEACEVCADIFPVTALGFETYQPEEERFGRLQVATNTELIHEAFRRQRTRFLVLGALLLVSLVTGMVMIQRSIIRDLERARRQENFVSAVTHELRTPLSAIRLYGEMLLEGWTDDPAKQHEYHQRIMRETNRLSTLVERVLQKGRITSGQGGATSGDLNSMVAGLTVELEAGRTDPEVEDLELCLEKGLPPVALSAEAVAGILINLVENARKYAPYDTRRRGHERIRVSTRSENGGVVLEVADRGPGIPPEERERIFEAFHRMGDEATRTAPGTGLGLHLVRLHAESVGAEACVEPRPGGGSVFRVTFRVA
ncbi:MAG: HAMP domain-containing sensor histidine kinase [Planctomycetota bacterium]|nr:HAMP domain-containing sensor histidine kinase [Planctomycetota bacterium]